MAVFIISLAILLSVNISLLFFHYNKTSDYMETFFAFCYNINSAGNSAVNVEFKGGFYYGIQDIWCLFQRHFI